MIDSFSKTRFHEVLHLETWHPVGVLDYTLAAQMVSYIGFEEKILDEPFNRFADLTGLTEIHLHFGQVSELARKRREAYFDGPPVKSAFLAPTPPAFGVAHMFAMLMQSSPIEVRVFLEIDPAAEWLRVPAEILREDHS